MLKSKSYILLKTLHKLVLKAFFGPFAGTFFTMLFILLMQNVWKYVDDLIGKGLEWTVIAEIIFYILPTLIPLALPLAILLSSLMCFGKLGETYELTALKSSGISLYKIMRPLFLVVCIISVAVFFFSNHVIPYSSMKYKTLLYDIMNKKLALNIREGVFFNDIEGYSIKVARKDADGSKLEDIVIYDHSDKMGNTKVIRAESGRMYTSENERFLYLELFNGNSYEEVDPKNPKKRIDKPFARSSFEQQKIRFDLSSFNLERSDEEKYSNVAQFMNIAQLSHSSDSISKTIAKRLDKYENKLVSYYQFEQLDSLNRAPDAIASFTLASYKDRSQTRILKTASNLVRSSKSYIYNTQRELKYKTKKLRKSNIEWHRKFTLSIACIVLFLIGAPLGAIIRKGGMGMPVLISILFFLAYHISSITAEKSAIQGIISVSTGMWMSTFILTPLGLFFSYKASTDSTLFELSIHRGIFDKLKRIWPPKKS